MREEALIHLHDGPFALTLCPRYGGAITAFRHRNLDVLRPAGAAFFKAGNMRAAGCFPLVPFSGRIADGRFRFRGRNYRLEPNFPPEPHAIHGQGWRHPWQLAHAEPPGRAELRFEHDIPDTPFRYRARQAFELAEDGLRAEIAVANTGNEPMPAGVGLHPYFIRTPGATLRASVQGVWLADERNIPRERVPVPAAWDFARGLRVAELDNGFDGWDGVAEIAWPESGLRLRIEADPAVFGHLVVYVPPGRDFFCVEPVSHANDGFNLHERGVEGTGVRVLKPGDELSGEVRFRVS